MQTRDGGFNCNWLGWLYELPPTLTGKCSINLLAFITSIITTQLTIISSNIPQKLFSYTNSSSAPGWLYKASFTSSQPVYDEIVRWLAELLINNDAALYSQHIKGKHNIIAEILSRD